MQGTRDERLPFPARIRNLSVPRAPLLAVTAVVPSPLGPVGLDDAHGNDLRADGRIAGRRTVTGRLHNPRLGAVSEVPLVRRIVDVAPETVAVKITVSPMVGLLFDAVMMTDGGWPGRIVIDVATVSVNPLASVATARKV